MFIVLGELQESLRGEMFVAFGVVTLVAIALHQTISYFKMEMDWPSFIFAAGGSLVIRDVFPNKNLTNLHEVREL